MFPNLTVEFEHKAHIPNYHHPAFYDEESMIEITSRRNEHGEQKQTNRTNKLKNNRIRNLFTTLKC